MKQSQEQHILFRLMQMGTELLLQLKAAESCDDIIDEFLAVFGLGDIATEIISFDSVLFFVGIISLFEILAVAVVVQDRGQKPDHRNNHDAG